MSSSKSSTNASWQVLQGLEFSYAELPAAMYSWVAPQPVRAPQLCLLNKPLAIDLGFDPEALSTPLAVRILAGCDMPDARLPLAQAYAGYQFGHFAILGDGRSQLLGEKITPDGRRVDIQLKGSGATPYARRGDGRAVLAPMLREYLISEAMHALGVPTTRSLAVVTTGEPVYRDRALPGAILTRVAASHIRVGTFQFAALQGKECLTTLADYTIQRHYPDLKDRANPYLGLLERVIERQAALIARWMLLGFVHGVMNTDNVSIAGETIDYGPCAFIDAYEPATVFSSIDRQGRYAFGNQPNIGHWNLCRFAESLLPLLDTDETKAIELAQQAINTYATQYDSAWRQGMANKLGFAERTPDIDQLADDFLQLLQTTGADYTSSFRALMRQALPTEFNPWQQRRQRLIDQQPGGVPAALALMAKVNPVVIPRNHLVQAALDAAEQGDTQPFNQLLSVIQTPFDPEHQDSIYAQPAPPDAAPYVTYCGT
jgi:uncharacterized protein YdiU (UPF0061 family)